MCTQLKAKRLLDQNAVSLVRQSHALHTEYIMGNSCTPCPSKAPSSKRPGLHAARLPPQGIPIQPTLLYGSAHYLLVHGKSADQRSHPPSTFSTVNLIPHASKLQMHGTHLAPLRACALTQLLVLANNCANFSIPRKK